jgi:hypothetical protein
MARRTGFLTGGAVTAQARTFLQKHAEVALEKPVELGKLRALIRLLSDRGGDRAPAKPRREPAS